MTTPLMRKTCPQCGNQCLEAEVNCWACGELFVARPQGSGGAPTLVGAAARAADPFFAYRVILRRVGFRGSRLRWLGVALLAVALGGGVRLVAYWYAAKATFAERDSLPSLQAETPPTPRADMAPAPTLGDSPFDPAAGAPGASLGPIPRRARTNAPALDPWRPPYRFRRPRWRYQQVPLPPPFFPQGGPSAGTLSPRPTEALRPAVLPPATSPAPLAPAASARSADGLVAIHNTTDSTLDFEFAPARLSGTVAPLTQIVIPLPTGKYNIILRGAARKDTLFDVQVERGHTYLLAFDTRHARLETAP